MKITAYKKLLVTLIALGGWLVSYGQQYPDSLLLYLGIASRNNPTVQQKFIEYEAALQKIPQAGSLSDPELNLGVFLTPMELVSGNQRAEISLMQMFPWFGVLRNAKDEMSLMANAKYEEFRDSKLQVFYDVQRTWYDLYKIKKEISISEKNIEILKIIERLALTRYKATPSGGTSASPGARSSVSSQNSTSGGSSGMNGMSGGQNNTGAPSRSSSAGMQNGSMAGASSASGLTDLYRIQIETAELANNIALLRNQEQSVTAGFNSYLSRPSQKMVYTSDTLLSDTLDMSMETIIDSILSRNPMLAMLEFEKQSYQSRKKMVKGMGFPMVGLGLNYSVISQNEMSTSEMNGGDMIMPMMTVTLPIYRKKYRAMQNEADFLSNAASLNYSATANSLRVEYYQAIQLYQDARRRVKLYEDQYYLASKTLDLMLKSFSASSSVLTDVLRIQQQTLDYELKNVVAVADLNISVAWLKRLMAFRFKEL